MSTTSPAAPDAALRPGPEGAGPALIPASDRHAPCGPVTGPAGVVWSAFGAVVPVLAGSAGSGASVFAAATVDALQRAGRCALLVDTAEPSRSGLCSATEVDGQDTWSPAFGFVVRYHWRRHAVIARCEPAPDLDLHTPHSRAAAAGDTGLSGLAGLEPAQWLPLPPLEPLHTTVVDLGQDWARPHTGGGDALTAGGLAWLRAARAGADPRPVLVVRATRPSLAAAEAALARLDGLIGSGRLVAPARLVVMAAWRRGWPKGVVGTAGARVARLLDDAVFVPYDRDLDLGGITAAATPPKVQAAVAGLLDQWGLLHNPPPVTARPRAHPTESR